MSKGSESQAFRVVLREFLNEHGNCDSNRTIIGKVTDVNRGASGVVAEAL